MAAYCFAVLNSHFEGTTEPRMPFDTTISCPMFITLHKNGDLRGCIGCLHPQPLSAMRDYVHSSAFKDRRFSPLQRHELPQLDLSVSLLVNYEATKNCYDWEVGTHGIMIEFEANNRSFSGTYLPEVAREQSWTQQEAVASLLRKAGYHHAVSQELLMAIRCTRYQSSKVSMSYRAWLAQAQTHGR